jgi:hypothetical protein
MLTTLLFFFPELGQSANGPYTVAATELFLAGGVTSQVYLAGAVIGQVEPH